MSPCSLSNKVHEFFFFFLAALCCLPDLSSNQGWNSCPLLWKLRVLPTGPLGILSSPVFKSLSCYASIQVFIGQFYLFLFFPNRLLNPDFQYISLLSQLTNAKACLYLSLRFHVSDIIGYFSFIYLTMH